MKPRKHVRITNYFNTNIWDIVRPSINDLAMWAKREFDYN